MLAVDCHNMEKKYFNLQDIALNSGSCTEGVLRVIWQFNKEMAYGKKKLFLCLDFLVSSVQSHRPDGQ